jgi:hypothetical protein
MPWARLPGPKPWFVMLLPTKNQKNRAIIL